MSNGATMLSTRLTVEEKITRAKIVMLKKYPFWAYLVMHMETKAVPWTQTACVRQNSKYIYYNHDWMDKLTEEETIGLLCHEITHVAFDHPGRRGVRGADAWNIAIDLWTNATLVKDRITLPRGGLIPKNDSYSVGGVRIEKLSEKFSEQIFALFPENPNPESGFDDHSQWGEDDDNQDQNSGGGGGGENGDNEDDSQGDSQGGGQDDEGGDDEGNPDGSSSGDQDGDDQKKGGSKSKKPSMDWARIMAEALQHAKMQGRAPSGAERWVEVLHGRVLDWRSLLQAAIVQMLPYDYTFARPSRRSVNAGIYLPSIKKENMELAAVVDTSGSMSARDLAEFKGLMIDVVRTFDNITVHIVVCDAQAYDIFVLNSQTLQQFIEMPFEGGGGTDFRPAFEQMQEKIPNLSMCAFYTDGFGSFPEVEPPFKTVWLLQPSHCGEDNVPFGRVLPLERYPLPGGE